MSRITKNTAKQVAIKMTEKKQQKIDELRDKIENEAKKIHLDSIPDSIMKASKEYPSYFNYSKKMNLGRDFGWGYKVNFDELTIRTNNSVYIKFTDTQLSKLVKQYHKVLSLEENLEKLKDDIEVALYSLRTHKKVQDEFPEAAKHLPANTTTAIAINFESIKDRL